jgi:excisionase family DNA binding protein
MNNYNSNEEAAGIDSEEQKEFLTPIEVSKLLRIGRDRAYELMHRDGFPALRFGHNFVVRRKKLMEWIEREESHGAWK